MSLQKRFWYICHLCSPCGCSLAQLCALLNNMSTLMASTSEKQLQGSWILPLGVFTIHHLEGLFQDGVKHLWNLAQVNSDPCYPARCLPQYQTHLNSVVAPHFQCPCRTGHGTPHSFLSYIRCIEILALSMLPVRMSLSWAKWLDSLRS